VARNSGRPDLPYRFVVVKSPLYNAFACPGGIIFVSSTLVSSMKDEAELAGVLAHEVGHVSHRHALQSIRRAKFFEGVGKITAATMKGDKGQQFQSMIGDLQGVLFDKGLDQNMEYEADRAAVETAYRTGYDPAAFTRVLEMLRREEAGAKKEGSWFGTHPPLGNRIDKTKAQTGALADAGDLARAPGRFAKAAGKIP
jgi:predicted Zn-dependent protease